MTGPLTRTLVHLSDLHFGRIHAPTLEPLVRAVHDLKPDLVAVSGDLTQRAKRAEFEEARVFLDRLPLPRIVVPGNHDVPLRNPYLRFVSKWKRFREHIHDDADQIFRDDALAAIGINTARAFTWKGGRINREQMETVRRFFQAAPAGALKVLVAHHPLDLPVEWTDVEHTKRSKPAFEEWAECGIDLILAGHEHKAAASGGAARLRHGNHDAVIVQAGTATSTRRRGEPNSFNVIRVSAAAIVVERRTWKHETHCFDRSHEDTFARG